MELADLYRLKEISGGQESNHLNRATSNGSWLSSVPHRPNDTDFS